MALKLLQPGLRPIGQWDLQDSDQNSVVGGEVGHLQALDVASDAYASDSAVVGPQAEIALGGGVNTAGTGTVIQFSGLLDEGTGGANGYGTLFGSVIGGTTGQGTGLGDLPTKGVVTVGPRTTFGSGKATMWTQKGLYGITSDATTAGAFSAFGLNDLLAANTSTGKWAVGTDVSGAVGADVYNYSAVYVGTVNDSSLVSTTFTHASGTAGDAEYAAIYWTGLQSFEVV